MRNFKNNIDRLVSKVLNEEIENKAKQISEQLEEGEWTEIEVDEQQLKGGQKKIDVAEPKGKITAADFKKLRDNKTNKKEVDEFYFEFDGDDSEDEEMEMGRDNFHVTRKPKMMGSFDDDHGFYDEDERQYTGDFDFDFDEEEFDDFDSFDAKYGGKQRLFAPGEEGKKFFDMYKEKFGKPFRVRTPRDMGEAETEEGNAFSGALADAKKSGKDSFEVDGKTYNVKENRKSSLKLLQVVKDVEIVELARDACKKLIEEDYTLAHVVPLQKAVLEIEKEAETEFLEKN